MNFEIGSEKKVIVRSGTSKYEMRVPKIGEQKALEQKLKAADPLEAYDIYDSFFMSLGLTVKASDILDASDYLDLIEFIFNPKKKTVSPQS